MEKKRREIFDRAYRKAAEIKPGSLPANWDIGQGQGPLAPLEEEVLLEQIQKYEQRKQEAFQDFRERAKKKYPEMPEVEIKLLFKQYWEELVMS